VPEQRLNLYMDARTPGGMRYTNLANSGEQVRVMPGNPADPKRSKADIERNKNYPFGHNNAPKLDNKNLFLTILNGKAVLRFILLHQNDFGIISEIVDFIGNRGFLGENQ
jgi:hypothetical protein